MARRRDASRTPGIGGRLALTLFFAVFLLVGMGVFAAMLPTALSNAATRFWVETPCVIEDSRHGLISGDGSGWRVTFRYTYQGDTYISDRIDATTVESDEPGDLRRSQQLAPGTRTTCHVNPREPSEAVLRRAGLGAWLVPFFPLIFVAIGASGIWWAWRGVRTRAAEGAVSRVDARQRAGRLGPVVGMVLGGVFLAAGLGLMHSLLVRPWMTAFAARDWVETPCEIVSSRVETHQGDDSTTYSVQMVYRYEFDGRAYVSNQYRFIRASSSGYKGKAEVVRRHPAGSRAVCFVNPADPTEAVFDRSRGGTMWIGLVPLAFALVGGGMMWGMARQWRAGRAGGARPFIAASPGVPAPARVTLADRRAVGAPVVLVPKATRRQKLIGLTIAAVFWNGIVSVFVVSIFSESGGFRWFLALFLVPFVGVGLLLIGMVARELLGLSNPVPRVSVDRDTVAPGEALELTWELLGRAQKLQRLRIVLEGREEATYRRGTDTRTDRAVFATLAVMDTTEPHAMAAGRARLALPARAMHSFEAPNNKVVWSLKVHGEIPRWPDIDDEFPITVAATQAAGTEGERA